MGPILRRVKVAYVLLGLFGVMLLLGLVWGGFGEVMANGILVCLDCIGLI